MHTYCQHKQSNEFFPCFRNYLKKKKMHSVAIVSGELRELKTVNRTAQTFPEQRLEAL
jgi:hypothetical protein